MLILNVEPSFIGAVSKRGPKIVFNGLFNWKRAAVYGEPPSRSLAFQFAGDLMFLFRSETASTFVSPCWLENPVIGLTAVPVSPFHLLTGRTSRWCAVSPSFVWLPPLCLSPDRKDGARSPVTRQPRQFRTNHKPQQLTVRHSLDVRVTDRVPNNNGPTASNVEHSHLNLFSYTFLDFIIFSIVSYQKTRRRGPSPWISMFHQYKEWIMINSQFHIKF